MTGDPPPPAPRVYEDDMFPAIRDHVVVVGRAVLLLEPEVLEAAIAHGERALAVGPILDPTAFRDGADELERQLRAMRAVLACRRSLEELRA